MVHLHIESHENLWCGIVVDLDLLLRRMEGRTDGPVSYRAVQKWLTVLLSWCTNRLHLGNLITFTISVQPYGQAEELILKSCEPVAVTLLDPYERNSGY